MTDQLRKYLSADRSTRIQILSLDRSWQTGLAHQKLPPVAAQLLGELAAAGVLLAGNLKFDGSVVLQLHGNGPVRMIMVECTDELDLRATAQLRPHARWPEKPGLQSLLNPDGQGRFNVMLDMESRPVCSPPYQGIVPLEGERVASALEHYMHQSEQLETRLWLAASETRCAGLLLQRMPADKEADEPVAERGGDTWNHLLALANTLQYDELLHKPPETIIHQLFWQEQLMAFPAQGVRWHCPCTRERVADMLRSLGRQEIEDILAEQGHVHIDCNFCGKPYEFDAVDCAALFLDSPVPPQTPRTLH